MKLCCPYSVYSVMKAKIVCLPSLFEDVHFFSKITECTFKSPQNYLNLIMIKPATSFKGIFQCKFNPWAKSP